MARSSKNRRVFHSLPKHLVQHGVNKELSLCTKTTQRMFSVPSSALCAQIGNRTGGERSNRRWEDTRKLSEAPAARDLPHRTVGTGSNAEIVIVDVLFGEADRIGKDHHFGVLRAETKRAETRELRSRPDRHAAHQGIRKVHR